MVGRPTFASLSTVARPVPGATREGGREPYLIVTANSIEVISRTISAGREIVTLDGLREALIHLPLTAWPFGRVVAIQQQGLNSPLNRRPIVRNMQAVTTLLEALPVLVDPWPP